MAQGLGTDVLVRHGPCNPLVRVRCFCVSFPAANVAFPWTATQRTSGPIHADPLDFLVHVGTHPCGHSGATRVSSVRARVRLLHHAAADRRRKGNRSSQHCLQGSRSCTSSAYIMPPLTADGEAAGAARMSQKAGDEAERRRTPRARRTRQDEPAAATRRRSDRRTGGSRTATPTSEPVRQQRSWRASSGDARRDDSHQPGAEATSRRR